MITSGNIMTGADVYGSEAPKILGVDSNTTGANSSGSVGNVNDLNTKNHYSWLALILVLVAIRIFEMSLKSG